MPTMKYYYVRSQRRRIQKNIWTYMNSVVLDLDFKRSQQQHQERVSVAVVCAHLSV